MPRYNSYNSHTQSNGPRKRRATWSNSVGTRVQPRYWNNPTVGQGKDIRRDGRPTTLEAQDCLAVTIDAFSDKTMQPRVPDGKATESVGMKYQMINELEQMSNETLDILFFPGLNCCAHVKGGNSKSISILQNAALTKIQRITSHVTGKVTLDGTTGEITFTQTAERAVAKWRLVSYGMLLSLVNNSEENDGWWEACRITASNDVHDYNVSLSVPSMEIAPIVQPINFFPKIPELSSSEMLNQGSYSTGKLRNIHNVTFQLNPEFDDRNFVDLTNCAKIDPGPTSTLVSMGFPLDGKTPPKDAPDTNTYKGISLSTAPKCNRVNDEVISQFIDNSFDSIFIRIHGVGASVVGRSPSRLTMHTVMNQEIVYDEKALNAKFHQGAVYHKLHDNVTGNAKAAQPNKNKFN